MFEEKFGERAVSQDLIRKEQLEQALKAQEVSRGSGLNLRLGEILVRKKWLKPGQVKDVLRDLLIEIQWCNVCNKYYNCVAFESTAIYRCPLCRRQLQYSYEANAISVEDDLEREGQVSSAPDAIDQMLGFGEPPAPPPITTPPREMTPEPIPPEELKKMLDEESKRLHAQPKPVPKGKGIIIRKPKKPET
jgi:hypothetical protein